METPHIDCNVVMLRHADGIVVSRQSDNQMPAEQSTDWKHRESNYLWRNHLYFTSTEPIKEGNWICKVGEFVRKAGQDEIAYIAIDKDYFKKVEATTDPTLGLPLIPNTWLKDKYVPSSGENLIKSVKLEQIEIRGEEEYELISSGEETIKLDCTPGFYTLNLTPENEVIILEEPERERGITISFSRSCIGQDRDKTPRKKCKCSRCLKLEGIEPDEYTELIAQIHSCYNKYELDESVTNILPKTIEEKVKWTKSNIKDLIMHLQWILEPPTL